MEGFVRAARELNECRDVSDEATHKALDDRGEAAKVTIKRWKVLAFDGQSTSLRQVLCA